MTDNSLSIYNASDIVVNQIASDLNIPDNSIIYFQADANIVIYSSDKNVIFSTQTDCAGPCQGPVTFYILNAILYVTVNQNITHYIGDISPRGFLSHINLIPSVNANPPVDYSLTKINDNKFSITSKNPYFSAAWPVNDPKVLRIYSLGYSWIIFDTADIPQFDSSIFGSQNTGVVIKAETYDYTLGDVNIISLSDLNAIANYADPLVQDCLCYLFLTHNGQTLYPYLQDSNLNSNLMSGTVYPQLVESYLKFHSPSTIVNQNQRFNIGYSALGDSKTKVEQTYNINRPAGVQFCNQNKTFCSGLVKELCFDNPLRLIPSTEKGDSDIVAGLQSFNIHLESDTCRRFFSVKEEGINKEEVISQYLKPICKDYSAKFASSSYRSCCAATNNENCKLVNSLFTDNGNCSCFIQSADLEKLYNIADIEKTQIGLDGVCYSDCVLNSQSYDSNTSYNVDKCNSQICIISNTADVNITNARKSTTTINQRACCSNLSDTSCQ